MSNLPWVILSHTNGLREYIVTHEAYFECESDSLAVGILSFCFLSMGTEGREKEFASNLNRYNYDQNKYCSTINRIKERFENWLLPVFQFFNFTVTEKTLRKVFILPEASGEVINEGLIAYKNKQKGKQLTEKNRLNVASINNWWGIDHTYGRCEICECHQPVFLLYRELHVCFDCYIGHTDSSKRDVFKEMFDAVGQRIRLYTKYITPRREIVFFDRDGDRMIYMNGKIGLPVGTELIYKI